LSVNREGRTSRRTGWWAYRYASLTEDGDLMVVARVLAARQGPVRHPIVMALQVLIAEAEGDSRGMASHTHRLATTTHSSSEHVLLAAAAVVDLEPTTITPADQSLLIARTRRAVRDVLARTDARLPLRTAYVLLAASLAAGLRIPRSIWNTVDAVTGTDGPATAQDANWAIYLCSLAHEVRPDDRLLRTAEAAAARALALPGRTTYGTFRAYALIRLYRFTGSVRWLREARDVVDARANGVVGRSVPRLCDALEVAVLAEEMHTPELASLPLLERGARTAGA